MTQDIKKPQVAFLATNFEIAKQMGQLFKKLSIVIDTFLSPEDFLIAQITSKYDLILLDVDANQYEGSVLATKKELRGSQIAFFVNGKEAMAKLAQTYSLEHLGYIFSNLDVVAQVKNILIRFNANNKLKSEINYYNTFKHDVLPKHEALVRNSEILKEKLANSESQISLLNSIYTHSKKANSIEALLDKVFSETDLVKSHTLLELSSDFTKLNPVAPQIKSFKIPSVWLGKKHKTIDTHAISLVQNIAASLTKNSVVTLLLSKTKANKDAVVLLEINEDAVFDFNWALVELTLSGLYAQYMAQNSSAVEDQSIRTAYELFEVLNKPNQVENLHLLAFDLSDIFDFKNLRGGVTFDWSQFWSDFRGKIANLISDGQVYTLSAEQVVLVVDDFIFEESFAAAKDFCGRLGLSKYFSGLENFEVNSAKISMKEIPFSEFALLSYLEQRRSLTRVKPREI